MRRFLVAFLFLSILPLSSSAQIGGMGVRPHSPAGNPAGRRGPWHGFFSGPLNVVNAFRAWPLSRPPVITREDCDRAHVSCQNRCGPEPDDADDSWYRCVNGCIARYNRCLDKVSPRPPIRRPDDSEIERRLRLHIDQDLMENLIRQEIERRKQFPADPGSKPFLPPLI